MAYARDIAVIAKALSDGVAYAVDPDGEGCYVFFDHSKFPSRVPPKRMCSDSEDKYGSRGPLDYMVWYPCALGASVASPWGTGQPTVNVRRSGYGLQHPIADPIASHNIP